MNVLVDDVYRFINRELKLPTTAIHLYNGRDVIYKEGFIRQSDRCSTFSLMQQCAYQLRLSKESFQHSLLATSTTFDRFLLPYNKYISLQNERKFAYRILHRHKDLRDILYCHPETFNYIFHQSKTDFFRLLKASESFKVSGDLVLSSLSLLLAGLLKKLNYSCNEQNFERISKLLEIPITPFIKQNIRKIVDYVQKFYIQNSTAEDFHLQFITGVEELCNSSLQKFFATVSINNSKIGTNTMHENAIMTTDIDCICITDDENCTTVRSISYDEVIKVKLTRSRRKALQFSIYLKDSTVVNVSSAWENSMEMESCLAVIDLYYRANVKSKMLIEPMSIHNFDPYSATFNELNQSLTSTNIYNIIDKSVQPLDFVSFKKGHEVLRELGFKVGWYVLLKQTSLNTYPLCIVLNSEASGDNQIHHIRIVNKDGYYWVDEHSKKKKTRSNENESQVYKYRSLDELIESLMIKVRNKLVTRPIQIVTEEMVLDLRKNRIDNENDNHKQSYMISLFCLQLVPTSLQKSMLCSAYKGTWIQPEGNRITEGVFSDGKSWASKDADCNKRNIRAFLFNQKYIDENSFVNIARIAEISRPEFVHENILKCHGFARNSPETVYLVYDSFGNEFTSTFAVGYSNAQLFEFGNQIKCGLQFLHDRDIVHGFPALHNVYINKSWNRVKLAKIGILTALMKGSEETVSDNSSNSYLKARKHPELNEFLAGWFSQRRIQMLHKLEDKLQETWDRYVFGCTLWQLFNAGATPLPDKSDQEILDRLEGKESWFSGGSYFKLPHTQTEFLNKLQKIICVCVTWGNKDNQEKYEFRKIAETYESLSEIVCNDKPTNSDYILKAGNGKLDFDVSPVDTSAANSYTVVEGDKGKRVVLVSNKKASNVTPKPAAFSQVSAILEERGRLLKLGDLTLPGGGRFPAPAPGCMKVEAICKKLTLTTKVWVKSYSKCKDIPEEDYMEEVQHLLRFQHQNIVPLLGCVLLEDSLLLVTPSYSYCRSLRDFIDTSENPITERQRRSYATQVCSGMKYLASNKCVHRNLRLAHIYLTTKNDVVITNFGLARVSENLYYRQKRELASDAFLIYPPEVISVMSGGGKVKFTSGCDVWSYGVLLWELYSGDIAYNNLIIDIHGNQDIHLLDAHFRSGNVLEPQSSWPSSIQTAIRKCFQDEGNRLSFFEVEEILAT